MLLSALLACADPEPVVRAVEPPRTAEEVKARREAQERRVNPRAAEGPYTKADGVYVDVRYFAGRRWDVVRGEAEKQLGAVLAESELPGGDREVRLERGTVRLRDGGIILLDVPLPEAMRRGEALAALGLPPTTDRWLALTLEFRLTNAWGFRRIRMERAGRDSEDVVRVEAWKVSPSDT